MQGDSLLVNSLFMHDLCCRMEAVKSALTATITPPNFTTNLPPDFDLDAAKFVIQSLLSFNFSILFDIV